MKKFVYTSENRRKLHAATENTRIAYFIEWAIKRGLLILKSGKLIKNL